MNLINKQILEAVDTKPLQEFPFKSLKQTLELLDCSKFYLYKLIRKGILHPYYLEKNELDKPTGKPYFKQSEIAQVFFRASK
ncbi:hypothetical protein [Reichenbachiella sp.]|uniref:hypothetical protein n=1 Tax=Reichenbachiella sp. TaxID=2184521 RepID=UPI003BB06533